MSELIYWIWLSLACSPGARTFAKLIDRFDGARAVYEADIDEISRAVGYRTSDRCALADKSLDKAEEIYSFCTRYGVGILSYADAKFPSALRKIPTPPVLLYYRGQLPDFERAFSVAMVGTRSISDYGRDAAFRVAHDLASAGATVVSGMALGVDGVSLAGALAADRATVAVLGSGIDVCYPSQHLTLAREIVKRGCVMTEFPPHKQPTKYTFPIRNRIISGLCTATLVIEGREKSGSVITARRAKEQERAVYAYPGRVGDKNSEASSLLIKNGARLFTCADDIVRDFEDEYRGVLNPFALNAARPVDMMATLRKYAVCAVSQSDDIFSLALGSDNSPSMATRAERKSERIAEATQKQARQLPRGFDKKAEGLYNKIPAEGDCLIESLIDSEYSLRDVMRGLLKLELGSFIVMLPGERVMRNIK